MSYARPSNMSSTIFQEVHAVTSLSALAEDQFEELLAGYSAAQIRRLMGTARQH